MAKNEMQSQKLAEEMVEALNKGFKTLHLSYEARADTEKRLLHVQTDDGHFAYAHFRFAYKIRQSAKENLLAFKDQLEADYYGQKTDAMRNLSTEGAYLYDAVEASSHYGENHNIFKERLTDWKDGMVSEIVETMFKKHYLARTLGMSDADTVKMAKAALKEFQEAIQKRAKETPAR